MFDIPVVNNNNNNSSSNKNNNTYDDTFYSINKIAKVEHSQIQIGGDRTSVADFVTKGWTTII